MLLFSGKRILGVFLLFFIAEVSLQALNASYVSECARTYDEAGHFVTGLMMHDFVAGLDWSSPVAFAENYYLHYPKVAIGHWPPVFYLVQGAWMLLFSASRMSVLVLLAFLAALMSLSIYRTLKPTYGEVAGVGGGLLFLLLPLVQVNTSAVMAEVLVALLAFWATLSFGKYVDTEQPRWAAWFTFFAALTIMTKANGLALVLLPPFVLLLTGRYRLLRLPSFWLPAAAIALVCGPWYWYTLDMLKNGPLAASPTFEYTLKAVPIFSMHFVRSFGIGLTLFGALGFLLRIVLPVRRRELDGIWASLGSLVVAALFFHWIVPAGFDPRFLILGVPPMICFVVAGVVGSVELLSERWMGRRWRLALVGIVAASLLFFEVFAVPGREWHGFGKVAAALFAPNPMETSVVLISSDPEGEGALVSEVAVRDRDRRHFVLRGSKVLSTSRWDGSEYQALYETTAKMGDFLRQTPVHMVVVDRSVPKAFHTPDQALLWETLQQTAGDWELVGKFGLTRHGVKESEAVHVYRQKHVEKKGAANIRIDLTEMLGRFIETRTPSAAEEP
ncbi:MAG: glycosyltransferase family 39 protein [Thermoanaerobaculia bacterium]